METNSQKEYLSLWVTGSFGVPEGKLDVESSEGNGIPLPLSPNAPSRQGPA